MYLFFVAEPTCDDKARKIHEQSNAELDHVRFEHEQELERIRLEREQELVKIRLQKNEEIEVIQIALRGKIQKILSKRERQSS